MLIPTGLSEAGCRRQAGQHSCQVTVQLALHLPQPLVRVQSPAVMLPHMFAAGSLADRYGGKSVLTAGVALWSLFTVITPQAAAAGTAPLLAARVLLGVGEGVAFPAIHSMIGEQTSRRAGARGGRSSSTAWRSRFRFQ